MDAVAQLLNQSGDGIELGTILYSLDSKKFEVSTGSPLQSLRLAKPGFEPKPSPSFNENLNLYVERPVFVSSERTKGTKFYPSIHKLEEQNMIVQIATDPDSEDKISISFFTTSQPYERTQRV